ncbi:MAG: UbiA family prenyltransferase [Verrucomicrobiales bacterium]|nr:UbiA family prenyltransferase [Verrucomicrobiales bacterium]
MLPRVNVVLKLSRVSNLPTVWSNCIAGWVLGGGIAALPAGTGVSDVLLLLLLIIGASLAYSAGMIMNDAVDFKFDAEHRPDRPLPSGEITLSVAWALAIAFLGGGFILMILAGASPGCTLLLGFMIVGYNVLHKRWTGSVFLMGACRLLLYLVAASVPEHGGWFTELVCVWAMALGIYTVGITLAARGEVKDKGTGHFGMSMLTVPLIAAAWAYFLRAESHMMLLIALITWAGWTAYCILLMKGDEEGRVSKAVALLIGGMLLIDAVAVSAAFPWLGATMIVMLPPVLLLQKRISAT